MQSLVIFSCLIAATVAVTPFFESPDNHEAAAFYKKPAGHFVPVAPAPVPVYKPAPAPVYQSAPAPVYKPAPAPVYKPAPAPVYQSAPPPVYKPAPVPVYKPAPVPAYQPAYKAPEYKSEYSQGATSYQSISLGTGEPAYKPQY